MLLTIFTPTYNRKEQLEILYNSLLKQEVDNFEWVIVDDGSIDNTNEIIEKFALEAPFSIIYSYQENGGKHRAINKGLDIAKGQLFFIVDSDDYLLPNATKIIEKNYVQMSELQNYAGIAGVRCYANGEIIGRTFVGEYVDCLSYEREKHGMGGDKAEIYYTSILRKFKLPEIDGETFIPEEIYHYRIAALGLKLRYINDKFYICEYLPLGLTSNINKLICNNFEGYTIRCKELLKYEVPLKRKVEVIGKYVYFGRYKGWSFKMICDKIDVQISLAFICWILAYLYFNIKKININ